MNYSNPMREYHERPTNARAAAMDKWAGSQAEEYASVLNPPAPRAPCDIHELVQIDASERRGLEAVIAAAAKKPGIDATLAERGTRYGEFKDQAVIAQGLASVALAAPKYHGLAPDMREALSVIFNKVARILNGDPNYSDSWHDIAGYATLVDKRLKLAGK